MATVRSRVIHCRDKGCKGTLALHIVTVGSGESAYCPRKRVSISLVLETSILLALEHFKSVLEHFWFRYFDCVASTVLAYFFICQQEVDVELVGRVIHNLFKISDLREG